MTAAVGRPREFDRDEALDRALTLFWRKGYSGTSLDDLTQAMGLSRSSFYGAFGSKHEVLLEAVRVYTGALLARLERRGEAEIDPAKAAHAVFATLLEGIEDETGCLLFNSVAELAPQDEEVCAVARAYADRVLAMLSDALCRAGHGAETAGRLAGMLVACAFGLRTFRRVGVTPAELAGVLAQAKALIDA